MIVMMIILPNIQMFVNVFKEPNENWYHIKQYLLKGYVINSLKIVIITGSLTVLIGTILSWIISVYDFPLRKFFKWALILPLAIPPYIAAYTYNGMLSYTGIIQITLRNLNIKVNPKFFDIMSIEGAIFIFTIFLFPYVYMITRAFLEKQSASLIENGRVLGRSSLEIFWYVVLPILRGSIVGGVSIVILEILNDYGVVNYFGVQTFSTAIFKTWFGMGDIDSASRLASILIIVILTLLVLEKFLRGRRKYSFTTTKIRPISRTKLKGIKAFIASLFCFIIFTLGFLIPTIQLFSWSLLTYKKILRVEFIQFMFSSLSVALITAVLIVIFALIIANYCRLNDNAVSKIYSRITVLGYSIPGAVIAIGVIVAFVALDRKLQWLYKVIGVNSSSLVLSTSIVMLIFAYIIRFLAVGYNSVEAGFEKIGTKFSEASRTLGFGITKTFFKVDLPMIKGTVLSGFFLVFIEVLKELPLTLILRPFNFNTLATKAYEYANDEMIHEAAVASIVIILISFLAIYFFYKIGDKEEK
ncbi:iron ABC transporter permease [Clostridium aestuarii]|uniref:Iron ABC transporter permease n=1 Tax=Clostridium aestuarii TaxID=338193 RepID=A0ABT4CV91_9CLOT|nr:iron ABC transporter permease [Clostridium aestuarii]MCY6482891.1 iron ABC transporter permease [Clostridium aestuarii]